MALWNPFGKKSTSNDESSASEGIDQSADTKQPASGSANSGDESTREEVAEPTTVPASETAKPQGMFAGLKSAMQKTVKLFNTDIRDLIKEGRVVDDAFLDELYTDLIKTDMGVGPAGKIRDDIGSKFRARKLFMEDLVETARGTISDIMRQDDGEIHFAESGPTVIMVVGVNGAGKTTSIAKLAHRFTSQGKTVVLGAGDTFRAAAVEQLTVWAGRMGCEIVKGRQGSDPASVAYQAADLAKKNSADICIVDTAGRLQTQSNLMDELGKIRRVTEKVIPGAPHEVLLVLDATAGQNAISQARGFSEAAGCTGVVLAKLDGSAKGGVAIPIRQEFGLPVKFIGLGETHDALAAFDVNQYVEALFDPLDQ
ncbi:MAG: signal recognition particle-docking protein FtsY [Mariniblastus sp.]|nr:signal recognition particle-docking protein FtsY [Mariniblastus sp.]